MERFSNLFDYIEMRLQNKLLSLEKLADRNKVDLVLVKTCLDQTRNEISKLCIDKSKPKVNDGISQADLRFFQRMILAPKSNPHENRSQVNINNSNVKKENRIQEKANTTDSNNKTIMKKTQSKVQQPTQNVLKREMTPKRNLKVVTTLPNYKLKENTPITTVKTPKSDLKQANSLSKSPSRNTISKQNHKFKAKTRRDDDQKDNDPNFLVKLRPEAELDHNSEKTIMKSIIKPFSNTTEETQRSCESQSDSNNLDPFSTPTEPVFLPYPAQQDAASLCHEHSLSVASSQLAESRASTGIRESQLPITSPGDWSQPAKPPSETATPRSTALISIEIFGEPGHPPVAVCSKPQVSSTSRPRISRVAPLSLAVTEPLSCPAEDQENEAGRANRGAAIKIAGTDRSGAVGLKSLIDHGAKPALFIGKPGDLGMPKHTSEVTNKNGPVDKPLKRKPNVAPLGLPTPRDCLKEISFDVRELSPQSQDRKDWNSEEESLGTIFNREFSRATTDLLDEVDELCVSKNEYTEMPSDCKRAVLSDILNSLQRENLKDTLNFELLRKHIEQTMNDQYEIKPHLHPSKESNETKLRTENLNRNTKNLLR